MKKSDFILIAVILGVAAIMFALLYGANTNGDVVQIQVDGKTVETLSLNENTTYDIKTSYGSNVLEIKDGKAKMISADCPDEICVNHKAIDKNGESIICLPHKVVVTVVGKSDNGPDTVV